MVIHPKEYNNLMQPHQNYEDHFAIVEKPVLKIHMELQG